MLCRWTRLDLLYTDVVILQVQVLEENQVMISMYVNAVLAEGICALVARTFNLVVLVAGLLAVRNWFALRRRTHADCMCVGWCLRERMNVPRFLAID